MRNPGLAEAYCDRMYDAVARRRGRSTHQSMFATYGDASDYEMYLALIQVPSAHFAGRPGLAASFADPLSSGRSVPAWFSGCQVLLQAIGLSRLFLGSRLFLPARKTSCACQLSAGVHVAGSGNLLRNGRNGPQVFLERRDERNRAGDAPDSSNWAAVAQLLGRKHDRIEPLHALQLVPEEVGICLPDGPLPLPSAKSTCW